EAYELLKATPLKELMEPAPTPLLSLTATLGEVSQAFIEHGNDFFYVTTDGDTLEGIVTITDLIRGRTSGASNDPPVREFMTRRPVVVAASDSCAVAAAAIREYRLKALPVVEQRENRKVVGCIRIRKLMALVSGHIRAQPAANVPLSTMQLPGTDQVG